MELNFELIKKSEYKISTWSGGTTTEMLIHPCDSSYGDRNFTWRISSATVELDESKFTSLPDYNRILMVLSGNLILKHEGQSPIKLKELEQDAFDGNIATDSEGKVTDFNLMMRKGICQGNVEVLHIESNTTLKTVFEEDKIQEFNECTDVYYNIKGSVSLIINESEKIVLENKDLLIVNRKNEKQSILFESYNNSDEAAAIVKTKIFY